MTHPANFSVSGGNRANGTATYLADPDGFGDTIKETSGSVVKNYVYRADDRLAGYSDGSNQVAYYYDGLGRRAAKTFSGTAGNFTQSFVYLGRDDRVLMAKSGDGGITTYIDGIDANDHIAEVKNGVFKGYVTDYLGSVLNGDVAGPSHSFGLFGEVSTTTTLPPISASSSPVNYGWQGLRYDTESGEWDNYARQYLAGIGRFTSQDPSGISGGLNLYSSRMNNPLKFVDRNGNSSAAPEAGGYSCEEIGQMAYNRCMAGMAAMYVSETGAAVGCVAAGPGAPACVGAVTACASGQALVGVAACSAVQQQAFNSCQAERNNEQTHEFQPGLPNLFDAIFN